MKKHESGYFEHHFLVAMPHLTDPNFARTVVYLIEHNEFGAMGLVINRECGLSLRDVLLQTHAGQSFAGQEQHCLTVPIHEGGPVEGERGFVLHPKGWAYESTFDCGALAMTVSQDILPILAEGMGPKHFLIVLGHAGWGAGQLEKEICDNVWLVCPADNRVLFETPLSERWQAAAEALGITTLTCLSNEVGHA